jgi:hypothetical protein
VVWLAEFLQSDVAPLFSKIDATSRLTESEMLQSAMLCLVFDRESEPIPPGWSLDERSALANRIATEMHIEAGAGV